MAQEANNSGIRNAEVRHKRRIDDLSTRGHIRRRSSARREARLENKTNPSQESERPSTTRPSMRSEQLSSTRLSMEAERVFEEEGLEYTPEEIKEIVHAETPENPHFPFFIIILAIIKDVLDGLTLSGVGYVVSLVVSIVIAIIIFFWILSKGKAPWRKKQVRKSIERFVVANLADLVPILNLLPIETIFVLMVYSSEKELTQNVQSAFARLQQFKRFVRQ